MLDQLDELTQKKLDSILEKDISALTPSDCLFLKARQAYIPEELMETYAMYITGGKQQDPKSFKLTENFTYAELKKKAKSMGMQNVVGKSRVDLIKFIEEGFVF